MHAILQAGGKQFRVAPGDVIRVPKLNVDVGANVEFSGVLAVFGDSGEVLAGAETAGYKVKGTITANSRAKKVSGFQVQAEKAIQAHHRSSPGLHRSACWRDHRIGFCHGTQKRSRQF